MRNSLCYVGSIYAGTKVFLDDLPLNKVRGFEDALLRHVHDEFPEITDEIVDKGEMSDELAEKLGKIIKDFKAHYVKDESKG